MKGLKIAGSTLLLAFSANATTTPSHTHNDFTGVYIHVSPSYDTFKLYLNLYNDHTSEIDSAIVEGKLKAPTLNLTGGYRFQFSETNLIGFVEASASISSKVSSTLHYFPDNGQSCPRFGYSLSIPSNQVACLLPTRFSNSSVGIGAGVAYRIAQFMPYAKINFTYHDLSFETLGTRILATPTSHYIGASGFSVGLQYLPFKHTEVGLAYSANTLKDTLFNIKQKVMTLNMTYRF